MNSGIPSGLLSAVVVASGSGSRMGGICKQMYLLDGLPVVVHSIRRLLATGLIGEMIIVTTGELADEMRQIAKSEIPCAWVVTVGGATRQQSVFAGIAKTSPTATFFAVHDAVRPLVQPEDILRCYALAQKTGAAALGVPVKDTIKRVNSSMEIVETPDRSSLLAIQTPQIFSAALYRNAMAQALEQGQDYTDDCQLVEHFGSRVSVCVGSPQNIKITTPEDLAVATALLRGQKGGMA